MFRTRDPIELELALDEGRLPGGRGSGEIDPYLMEEINQAFEQLRYQFNDQEKEGELSDLSRKVMDEVLELMLFFTQTGVDLGEYEIMKIAEAIGERMLSEEGADRGKGYWTPESHREVEQRLFSLMRSLPSRYLHRLERGNCNGVNVRYPKYAIQDEQDTFFIPGSEPFQHIRHFSGLLNVEGLCAGIRGDAARIYPADAKKYIESWKNSLTIPGLSPKEGSIRIIGDTIIIEPSQLRQTTPTKEQIILGLHYMQFNAPEHPRSYASPALFDQIELHLKEDASSSLNPFEWAKQRIEIGMGYGAVMTSGMYPLDYLSNPYTQMATFACNGITEEDRTARIYTLDSESQHEAINQINQRCLEVTGQSILPPNNGSQSSQLHKQKAEILSFAIETYAHCGGDFIQTSQFREFLQSMGTMCENGLRIRRVIDLIRQGIEDGTAPNMAAKLGMEVAVSVFGHSPEEHPWWFKEDFELNGLLTVNPEGAAIISELAIYAGTSYREACSLFATYGNEILQLEGISQSKAIEFVAETSKEYGVSEQRKATGFLDFAIRAIKEVEAEEREELLKDLIKLSKELSGSKDPLSSTLTSSNENFYLPAFGELYFSTTGNDHGGNWILGSEISQVAEELARPLSERIGGKPAFSDHIQKLPDQSFFYQCNNPLTVKEAHKPTDGIKTPTASLVRLYSRIIDECEGLDQDVAYAYLGLLHLTQREPLNPTPNIFTFIQNVIRQTPKGVRGSLTEGTAAIQAELQKTEEELFMSLANLRQLFELEAAGVISPEELQDIAKWLDAEDLKGQIDDSSRVAMEAQRPSIIRTVTREYEEEYGKADPKVVESKTDQIIEREIKLADAIGVGYSRMIRLRRLNNGISILHGANRYRANEGEFKDYARSCLLRWQRKDGTEIAKPEITSDAARKLDDEQDKLEEEGFLNLGIIREMVSEIKSLPEAKEVMDRWCYKSDLEQYFISLSAINSFFRHLSASLTRVYEGDTSVLELTNEFSKMLDNLKATIRSHWCIEGFSFDEEIDTLVRDEVKLDRYVEMLPHLLTFENQILPAYLRKGPENERYSDVRTTHQHLGRSFALIGARLLTESRKPEESEVLGQLAEAHGVDSNVQLKDGIQFITPFLPANTTEREEDLDLKALFQLYAENFEEFQLHADRWALADIPYGPIGGRLHFNEPANELQVGLLGRLLRLENTPFRVIHNSTSLIYPGSMSRQGMRLYILMLALEGLLDPRYPELQIGTPSVLNDDNLSKEHSAILGSASMLGSLICAPFEADAFMTNQIEKRQTGARMVAMDAYPESDWERKNYELPFMGIGPDPEASNRLGNVRRRKDVLGRWHVNWRSHSDETDISNMDDIDIVHIVGATLRQVETEGPLAEAGQRFVGRFQDILKKHDLESVLSASWIYLREGDAYNTSDEENRRHFEEAVRPCMEAHKRDAEKLANSEGVIYEVREIIDLLRQDGVESRERILRDPKWQEEVEALLQRPELTSPFRIVNR